MQDSGAIDILAGVRDRMVSSPVNYLAWRQPARTDQAIRAGRTESTQRFAPADVNRRIGSSRPARLDKAESADLNLNLFPGP